MISNWASSQSIARNPGTSPCPAVTAPWPLARAANHVGSKGTGIRFHPPSRIEDDIPSKLEKMSLFLDKNGLEVSLKHVAAPAIFTIDPLSVDPVELAHTARQV